MKHPVHDNYYARRDGSPYSAPLANRGPHALQELLVEDLDLATAQLNLLDRTELLALADAAEELARMARAVVKEIWPRYVAPSASPIPLLPDLDVLLEQAERSAQ